jgi:hypothetical protein
MSSRQPRGLKRAADRGPSSSPLLPPPPIPLPFSSPSIPLAPSSNDIPNNSSPISSISSGRTSRAKKVPAIEPSAAVAAPLALKKQPKAKKAAVHHIPPSTPDIVGQEGCPAIRLTLKLIAVPSRLDELRQSLSQGAAPLTFALITRKIKTRAAKYDQGSIVRHSTPGANLVLLVRRSDGLILAGAGHESIYQATSEDMNPGINKDDSTTISNVFNVTHPPDENDKHSTINPARIGTTLSVELLTDRVSFTSPSKLYNSSVRRRYVASLKKVPGQKRPEWNDATEQIDTKVANFFYYVNVTFLLRVSPYSQDDETAMLDLDSTNDVTQTQMLKQILNSLWMHSRKQGNFQLTAPGGTVSKAEALIRSGNEMRVEIKSLYAEYVRLVNEEIEAMDRDKRKLAVSATVPPSLSSSLQAAKDALAATRAAALKAAAATAAAAAAAAATSSSSAAVTSSSAVSTAIASASSTYSFFLGAIEATSDEEDSIIIDDDAGPNPIQLAQARVNELQTSYNVALAASEQLKALDDALIVSEGVERVNRAKAKLEAIKVKMKAAMVLASSRAMANAKTSTYHSVSDVINSLEPEATADAALHPAVRALDLTASPLATVTTIAIEPPLIDTADDSPTIFRLKPYQRSAINWMLEREIVFERKKAEQIKSLHENAAAIAGESKQEETTISEGLEIRLENIFNYDATSLDDIPLSLRPLAFLGRLVHDSRERYLPIISAHGHNVGITVLGDDKFKFTGDDDETILDVSDSIVRTIQRVETYSINDAQIKDIKKDALRNRQEQQHVLTSRRAGKAPVSYVSEFQKEIILPAPVKGRKRPVAVLTDPSLIAAETPSPIEKKSKTTAQTLAADKKLKLNPSLAVLGSGGGGAINNEPAAIETVNSTDEEEEDEGYSGADGNDEKNDFFSLAPSVLPEYSVPLPWIFDTPVIRARDHPFWVPAAGLELDTGAIDLNFRVMKSRIERLGPSHEKSADVPPASEKAKFRLKPCCGYFTRMGTMDIARERCTACKKRDLFANPKASRQVVDATPSSSTPVITTSNKESVTASAPSVETAPPDISAFDGLARAGILSDEMGLGKTLEIIGLVVVHPRSSQPFDSSGCPTGTYALDKAVRSLSAPLLYVGLTELSRLPTTASISFQVCNSRALNTWNEALTQTYRSFVRQNMFELLGSADNSVLDSRATLVIAPASIIGQWQSEIARWCPKLAVVVFSTDPNWRFCATSGKWLSSCNCGCYDSSSDIPPSPEDAAKLEPLPDPLVKDGVYYPRDCPHGKRWTNKAGEWPCCAAACKERTRLRMFLSMASADVVLASYDQLQAMTETQSQGFASLRSFMWWRCVLDEIQQVDTQAEEAMSKQLKKDIENRSAAAMSLQAVNRWAVSGTPIETPSDMKAILRFLRHQPFADTELWKKNAEPALRLTSVKDDTEKSLKKLQDLLLKSEHDAHEFAKAPRPPAALSYPSNYSSPYYALEVQRYNQNRQAIRDYGVLRDLVESNLKAALAASESTLTKGARVKKIHRALVSIRDRFKLNRSWKSGSLTVEAAVLLGEEMGALALTFDPKVGAIFAEAEELVSAAEVQPLVRRLGSGFDLLASLLRPTMWRNTQARVANMGQLSLPPVTEVVVRIQLTASEDHVLREIKKNYASGVISQLRQLVRAEGEYALAMEATESAKKAALANLGVAGFWAAPSMNPLEVAVVARQALWDLRSCCAHLTASSRIAERLGLRSHFAAGGSSLLEVMRLFVMVAEDKLQAATLEIIESATVSAQQVVRVLPRLRAILKKFAEDEVDEALADEWQLEDIASKGAHKDDKREKDSKEIEAQRMLAIDMMSKFGELKYFREDQIVSTVHKLIEKSLKRVAVAEKTFRFKIELIEKGTKGAIEGRAHLLKPGDSLEDFKFPLNNPKKVVSEETAAAAAVDLAASGSETDEEVRDSTHPLVRRKKIANSWGKAMVELSRAKRDLDNAIKGNHNDYESWACDACSLLNSFENVNCVGCNTRRPKAVDGNAEAAETEGRKSRKSKTNAAAKMDEIDGKSASSIFKSTVRTLRERELRSSSAEALIPDYQAKLNYALASENVYEKLAARAALKDKKKAEEDHKEVILDEDEEEEEERLKGTDADISAPEPAAYKLTDRAAAVAAILAASKKAADLRAKQASTSASSTAIVEEESLSCLICLDDIDDETTAALTPCGHLYHKNCIAAIVLVKSQHQHHFGAPPEDPHGEESNSWSKLKPTMQGQCPSCRTNFSAVQLTVVSSSAGGSKRAEEIEVIPLAAFLDHGSSSGASAAGGPVLTSSSSSSVSLSSSFTILPSSTVNEVRLEGAEAAAKKDASRKRGGNSDTMPRMSTRSVYEASIEAYGGKVACLVRRLKSMPDIEQTKAIVATSWPALRPLIAKALLAEGIEAGILDGTPSEMALVVQRFVSPAPSSQGPIPVDLTSAAGTGDATTEGIIATTDEVSNIIPTPAKRLKSGFSRKQESKKITSSRPPPRVLILSLGSDCAGLTLTAASHLFVLDPPLSPAIMSQLIGRICRQGQTRPCTVFHFVVKDSVEEMMIKVRAKLAKGDSAGGSAMAAAVDSTAKALLKKGRVDASAAASTDRLNAVELLYLLEGPQAQGGSK